MDDIFGQIEYRSKSDSMVMKILRSAMDKAHEKLQSKDGPIEFLHERSTFYELADILVEGGLSIVQEEMGILEEGSHCKIISDLMEIRHWLRGRIEDMKLLIVDKDRELAERLENELKLKQMLELKEKDLVYFHEKMKNAGFHDFPEAIRDGGTEEEDISLLKTSVDQQVLNLKQKLEDEEKILNETQKISSIVSCSSNLSFEFLDKVRNECSGSNQRPDQIRRMSSDIDILKETLDLAFGRMKSAEMLPLEKQWSCTIEKDVEYILVKGFIRNIQESFGEELMKDVDIELPKDNWFDFINEMKTLCFELKAFYSTNDVHEKPSIIGRTNSEPLPNMEKLQKEDTKSRYVAKMIKNHESIIQKQTKDWNFVRREVLRRKGSSSLNKRNEENYILERRMQDAISRLENLIKRNHKYGNTNEIREKCKIPKSRVETKKGSIFVESLEQEVEKLKDGNDDLNLHISLMEETYQLILQGIVKDLNTESCFKEVPVQESTSHSKKVNLVLDTNNLQEDTPRFRKWDSFNFQEGTPRSRKWIADNSREGTPRSGESFIQKLDSLSRCLEKEEDLMLRASYEIKEHSVNNNLVLLNCEEVDERDAIEWLLTDDSSTFTSVSEKLERALQQLYASKELLLELEETLEESDDMAENDAEFEKNRSFQQQQQQEDDEIVQQILSHNVLVPITRFQQVVWDFERTVHENLEKKCVRLDGLKRGVNTLIQPVALIRKRKLLYQKAFISRCLNLKLAESEVDLLGDQVDALLCLLEKIYVELNRNATHISQYFKVFDILRLIKTELNKGEAVCISS